MRNGRVLLNFATQRIQRVIHSQALMVFLILLGELLEIMEWRPFSILTKLSDRVYPSLDFNESAVIFAPKGSQPHGPVELVRHPLQTCPLSFTSIDNEFIVANNVKTLEPHYKPITHKCQNGFVAVETFSTTSLIQILLAESIQCATILSALAIPPTSKS